MRQLFPKPKLGYFFAAFLCTEIAQTNLKNLGRSFHESKLVWIFGLIYRVKRVKNSEKKRFSKIGLKPTQKPEHMNQMSTKSFWGVFCEVFGVHS